MGKSMSVFLAVFEGCKWVSPSLCWCSESSGPSSKPAQRIPLFLWLSSPVILREGTRFRHARAEPFQLLVSSSLGGGGN